MQETGKGLRKIHRLSRGLDHDRSHPHAHQEARKILCLLKSFRIRLSSNGPRSRHLQLSLRSGYFDWAASVAAIAAKASANPSSDNFIGTILPSGVATVIVAAGFVFMALINA